MRNVETISFKNIMPLANHRSQNKVYINGNLKGRPGWIFQRNKEAELMQFIAQAQQGLIQPAAPTTTQTAFPIATPQLSPFGQTQPAMTPQAAMARLTIA